LFAVLLLLVSFFNPYAGLAGLVATIIAISVSHFTGLNKALIQKGNYSYNALIIGIGMGAVYNFSIAFWILLTFIIIFSVILSVVFQNILGKYGLPFLTIPFVLCFWLVLLVTNAFEAIDFTYRNIYWMNDAYAIGSSYLVNLIMYFDRLELPALLSTFFKALSSLYFQNNVLAGMIIALGVLIHSRIIFSLIIIGFLTAYTFNNIVMAHPDGMNYYLIGGNFILISVAIGGFFIIPSLHSYIWAIVSVPITFIIVMALGRITGQWGLPVFSMPFCIVLLSFLYFFSLKIQKGRVVATPLQLYAPEKNLYNYLNNKERLQNINHIRLQLPFIGKWMVSQGYDGNITHKGDWSKALDFIIVDQELKTYKNYALNVEDFYCYNKPVLAPADGFVQLVEDYIDDNAIGKINQQKNWGNTIVIKHAEGLYTKMSHLKKHSFKVKIGDFVKQGDVIAACGNSGRSPEPHLHFQVQTTPYIGSKTFAYPLSYFVSENNGKEVVQEFSNPSETAIVSKVNHNPTLKQAFEFLPGFNLTVNAEGMEESKWEVFTDAYNNSYFYCHTTKSLAYFKRNETVFYFTSFDGDKQSLLYHFYIACYKIYLATKPAVAALDKFPLQLSKSNITKWLQDLIAPFYIFSRLHFESLNKIVSNDFLNPSVSITTKQILQFLSFKKIINESVISVADNRITSFTFTHHKKQIQAICTLKDY
jgi:urea transporter/murein DD-endopeptidase MepM/ murein hydrolase activator NlpD